MSVHKLHNFMHFLNKAVYGAKDRRRKTGHTVLNRATNQSESTACETCQTSKSHTTVHYHYDRQGRTAFRQYPIAPLAGRTKQQQHFTLLCRSLMQTHATNPFLSKSFMIIALYGLLASPSPWKCCKTRFRWQHLFRASCLWSISP